MKKLSHNIISNLAGNAIVILYGVLIFPLVLSTLGSESAGIISLYSTIFTALSFFDLGLGLLANREISKAKKKSYENKELDELISTLEVLYWSISLLASSAIFFSAPYLSDHFLKDSAFSLEELTLFIRLISVSIFFRWPVSFYFNINAGLQNLVILNIFKIIIYLFLMLILYILIVFYDFNIGQYLIVIANTNAFLVIAYFLLFKKNWGLRKKIVFRMDSLKGHIGYAIGSMFISSLTLLFLQLDKIYLSYLGNLSVFGIYTALFTLSIGIVQLIYPITGAFFPKMNELITKGKKSEILLKIDLISSILITLSFSFLVIFISFKNEILQLWIGEYNSMEYQSVFLLLVIGTTIYAISQIPYLVESAYGKVKFVVRYFFLINILYAMCLLYLDEALGLNGLALSYLVVNILYFIGGVYLLNKNIDLNQTLVWIKKITMNTLLAIILIYFVNKVKINYNNQIFQLVEIGVSLLIIILIFVIINKNLRMYSFVKINAILKYVKKN